MFSSSLEPVTDNEFNVHSQWENLSLYDAADAKISGKNDENISFIDDKALRMMQKMGYKSGTGLGKNGQGTTNIINIPIQLGKRGLGLKIVGLDASNNLWDSSKEDIVVEQSVHWLENNDKDAEFIGFDKMIKWVKEGCPKENIDNEYHFCDKAVLDKVLQAKNIFDELDLNELNLSRTKANPFETIKSVFFMNRAALKIANIDAATDFMFTKIDENPYHCDQNPPYFFADVCAGPGGFTEYILWRKKWYFKGFGLTLRDENDFKVHESMCASSATFQPLYGSLNDGNVCCPDNIKDFKEKVMFETEGKGVHFMMSDGGFSVDGNENMQEILSKNIYICQCLVALEIVRRHGHFVTKLFDIFTPFSVGLIYLIYKCFDKIAIFKPNSSRPANAERYLICYNLKHKSKINHTKKYLWSIVNRLWELKNDKNVDILEIVPLNVIRKEKKFFNYIYQSNNSLGERQIVGLEKLAAFCRNPSLVEYRQEELRRKSLNHWNIPDIPKSPMPQLNFDGLLNSLLDKPEILALQPREIYKLENFESTIQDLNDWHYCLLYSSKISNNCSIFASLGTSRVFRLQRHKWTKMKNLHLVRGTVLYGEFVKEKIHSKAHSSDSEAENECFQYSLHVIDALRLGDQSVTELKFHERLKLIESYCKAVNKEFQSNLIRVRCKVINKLSEFPKRSKLIKYKDFCQFCPLPKLGIKSSLESLEVNSILLLKTNEYQSFQSTYVLRAQVFFKINNDKSEDNILLDDINNYLKCKLT